MDIKQAKRDFVTYIVLLGLSILLYEILIPQQIVLRNSWSGDVAFTSQTFPKILAVALFFISALGIFQSAIKLKKTDVRKKEAFGETVPVEGLSLYSKAIPLIIFLVCIAYVFLFGKLGFLTATIIITPVLLLLLKCRKWQYYFSVYAFGACIYIVFRIILKVPLP